MRIGSAGVRRSEVAKKTAGRYPARSFKMSVKGDVVGRAKGFVYIRSWYTGMRYKAPEDKTYVYRGKCGTIASVEAKYARLG